nr:PREDICTED: histamine N-methyltransferase A-like [Latimeria chalumnae]|eukprot:XP_005997728.1 PREDICTED: histamine N-methyltransferase A-like [Latimeria chalumnae]
MPLDMALSTKSLTKDPNRYAQAYTVFQSRVSEHQIIQDFFNEKLEDYINSFAKDKETIKILGVGSGTGEPDLNILKQIQALYPGVPIIYEVLEPNVEHISKFKAAVSSTPNLKNVTFVWHQLTNKEFEKQVREKKEGKKFDFIHMIQMMYYVGDVASTIQCFRHCLEKTGRLMIIIMSGSSGIAKLWQKYEHHLKLSDFNISTDQIMEVLEEQDISYQYFELESDVEITDCLKGNEHGNLLLDFLTLTCNFSESVSTALKAEILEYLHSSEYNTEREGKNFFDNKMGVIMVDP